MEYWTRMPPKQFSVKRDSQERRIMWNPNVKTVDKVDHNHADLILQHQGPVAVIEFIVA
jgi:hypothetical protein